MGLLSNVWNGITGAAGSILNPIGTIANLGLGVANLRHAEKVDEQNYQAQLQANQINEQNNTFNRDMATKQFDEQQYLNRNSNQIAVADMAKAGLNPMAGNASAAMSAGGVQASQSQIAPALKGTNSVSAMSQLSSQLMQTAENGKERRQAKQLNDAGLQNAQILATLTDKNEIAKLAMECIENGIDPEFLKGVISSTPGATAGFKEVQLNDFNKTRLIHESRKAHAETKLAEADADMSDPATLLESLGIDGSDNNKAIRAMIGLLKIVRGNR